VRRIEAGELPGLPPLLGGARRDLVTAIGALDAELLVVLDSARVLPEDSWRAIDARTGDQ
jgi:purine-binding chemotaxis protein CheW